MREHTARCGRGGGGEEDWREACGSHGRAGRGAQSW
jgi:hypothetical protein